MTATAVRAFAARVLFGISLIVGQACAPSPTASPSAAAVTVAPATAFGVGLTCPGDAWPPERVTDTVPGITVRAIDRMHLEIGNASGRALSYRVSGWQVEQLDTCRGLLELESERGPLPTGQTVRVTLGNVVDRPDVPLTVGIWDGPCGEGCDLAPIALILVERSPVEPPAS